jgi:uncharacterized protein YraI
MERAHRAFVLIGLGFRQKARLNLKAKGHAAPFTAKSYVVNVARDDTLKLRSGPGTRFNAITEIPADATDIFAFDKDGVWDGDTWWYPVEWRGSRGYVGGSYLPHDQ